MIGVLLSGGMDSATALHWALGTYGRAEADVPDGCGVFLGGSTEWKLATMRQWGDFARRTGRYYHVARVNTQCRIARAKEAGADSIDGSSASRFADSLPRLRRAMAQESLVWR